MNANYRTRIIHTNLYGAQAKTIIDRLHGQLSDGKWENSSGYDKYWKNFDVETADDGEIIFRVNAEDHMLENHYYTNPFCHMSDAEFKTWIARKIKAVVNDERSLSAEFGEWNRRNTDHKSVLLGHFLEKHGHVVTVADVYCTYEALLGREIGITKYDSSTICRVFGTKRTDEEIAKLKAIEQAIEQVNAKYAALQAEIKQKYDNDVAKLTKELQASLANLKQEKKTEIENVSSKINIA